MATTNLLSLERVAVSASRLRQGARNAMHTERLLHPTKASAATKRDTHQAWPQSRSFAMATNRSTITDDLAPFQQLNYLGKMAAANPFITEKGAPPEASEFEFPLATLFKAPNREVGLAMSRMYAHAIREYGICGIEMGWPDPDSQFVLDVVNKMGCSPDTHSSTQGALWDVKYKPEGVYSEGTGKRAVSISHSMGEFAWHTDAAFEETPTRYFGFHIIHPDNEGGGVFRVLRAEDLARLLSPQAVEVLSSHEFDLKVPAEFFKGKNTVKGKLLDADTTTGRAFVRFRKDILYDPPSEDANANAAVKELNDLLDAPGGVGEHLPGFVFKENTVLLMDNARYLHSRTDIKDPKRWLRRVRFHGMPSVEEQEEGITSNTDGIPFPSVSAAASPTT